MLIASSQIMFMGMHGKKLYCNKDHLARASKLEKREKSGRHKAQNHQQRQNPKPPSFDKRRFWIFNKWKTQH